MDSISVELQRALALLSFHRHENTYSDIKNVDADTTNVLLAADTLLGRPLEGSNARVLDFVQVLNSLGDIDQQVGASGVGAETPDLPGIGDIPAVLVSEETGTDLEIVTGADDAVLDGLGEFLLDGESLGEYTVVLVLGLGEGDDARLSLDGLTVGNDRVGNLEGNTGVVVLEILCIYVSLQTHKNR